MGKLLQKGEFKDITIYLNGKGYKAQIRNVNFNSKFDRKKDIIQIKYPFNGELSKALCACFPASYEYIITKRKIRSKNDRRIIKLPPDHIEYLAIQCQ